MRHLFTAAAAAALATVVATDDARACCPAGPSGQPVVNADQSVILLWDAANKTEHFIRRASFKSDAEDFGFLVPTPAQPELAESGNDAFPFLQKLTEPEHIKEHRPAGEAGGCCTPAAYSYGAKSAAAPPPQVSVLDEKTVAGFHAVVLEARSAKALVSWLGEHHYAFSPQIEAWAKPYIEGGWKITALQVAKDKSAAPDDKRVAAAALRMSFKTDRPLFPYREPDYGAVPPEVTERGRLLRIYFIGDARYDGALEKDRIDEHAPREVWGGHAMWAGKLRPDDRKKTLGLLGLPETTTPNEWWLTELEDYWPYRVMPADVYFARSPTQTEVRRPPIIEYVSNEVPHRPDMGTLALSCLVIPAIAFQLRRRRSDRSGRLTAR